MGFYRQQFKIVQGSDPDEVAKQVEGRLAEGYDLHGDLRIVNVPLKEDAEASLVRVIYVQAVIKRGER